MSSSADSPFAFASSDSASWIEKPSPTRPSRASVRGSSLRVITIDSPRDGENVAVTRSEFKARIEGLRAGDSVFLNGRLVEQRTEVSPTMEVTGRLDVGPDGPDVVILEVKDALGVRRGSAAFSRGGSQAAFRAGSGAR